MDSGHKFTDCIAVSHELSGLTQAEAVNCGAGPPLHLPDGFPLAPDQTVEVHG